MMVNPESGNSHQDNRSAFSRLSRYSLSRYSLMLFGKIRSGLALPSVRVLTRQRMFLASHTNSEQTTNPGQMWALHQHLPYASPGSHAIPIVFPFGLCLSQDTKKCLYGYGGVLCEIRLRFCFSVYSSILSYFPREFFAKWVMNCIDLCCLLANT